MSNVVTTPSIPESLALLLNDPSQWPNYKHYRPLSQADSEIRLLSIYTDHESGRLCGRLKHVSLEGDHLPQYEAISYCWGPPVRQQGILIDGTEVLIRSSLHAFLQHLSLQQGGQKLPLWIDAICINQRDSHERNMQVALMGQIYSQAAKVLVWLGHCTSESEFLLCYLQHYMDARVHASEHLFMLEDKAREGYVDIANRPYWGRLWVVQEVFLAREVIVWCGAWSVQWSRLLEGLKYIHGFTDPNSPYDGTRTPRSGIQDFPEALKLFQVMRKLRSWSYAGRDRKDVRPPNTLTLRQCVSQFHGQKCTDPRDRVYALRGVSADGSGLAVDYTKSLPQIALEVVLLTWEQASYSNLCYSRENIRSLSDLLEEICNALDIDMRFLYGNDANLDVDFAASHGVHLRLCEQQCDKMDSDELKTGLNSSAFGRASTHGVGIMRFDIWLKNFLSEYSYDDSGWPQLNCRITGYQVGYSFYPCTPDDWPEDGDLIYTVLNPFRSPYPGLLGRLVYVFRGTGTKRLIGIIVTGGGSSWVWPVARSDITALMAETNAVSITNAPKKTSRNENNHEQYLRINYLSWFLSLCPPNKNEEDHRDPGSLTACRLLKSRRACRYLLNASPVLEKSFEENVSLKSLVSAYVAPSTSRDFARFQLRDVCLEIKFAYAFPVYNPSRRLAEKIEQCVLNPAASWKESDLLTDFLFEHDMLDRVLDAAENDDLVLLALADFIKLDRLVDYIQQQQILEKDRSSSVNQNTSKCSMFEEYWMAFGLAQLDLWTELEIHHIRRTETFSYGGHAFSSGATSILKRLSSWFKTPTQSLKVQKLIALPVPVAYAEKRAAESSTYKKIFNLLDRKSRRK